MSDKDPDSDALRHYLLQYFKKSGKAKINFNMTNLIGLGGECVVIRKKIKIEDDEKVRAIRASKLTERPNMFEELGFVETDTYDRLNIREMAVKELNLELNLGHPNIIKYIDNTFELIDDEFHHLTGKLTFKTLSFSVGPLF